MVLLDTSALIDSLADPYESLPLLRRIFDSGERIRLPALVVYEWLRGPRTLDEIIEQERLFPNEYMLSYEPEEARVSARIYRQVSRARAREIDIAIAATAIRHDAQLWTLNPADFADIPGLRLYRP